MIEASWKEPFRGLMLWVAGAVFVYGMFYSLNYNPKQVSSDISHATNTPIATTIPTQTPYPTTIPSENSQILFENNRYVTRDALRQYYAQIFPVETVEYFVRLSAECEAPGPNGTIDLWAVGGAGELGPLQIHPVHEYEFSDLWDDWKNPISNAKMGLEVASEGMPQGQLKLSPWTCQAYLGLPSIIYYTP